MSRQDALDAIDFENTVRDWEKNDRPIDSAWAAAVIRSFHALPSSTRAIDQFNELIGTDDATPLERLRFFCSLAMEGQDWMDVEPFFDALEKQLTSSAIGECDGHKGNGVCPVHGHYGNR